MNGIAWINIINQFGLDRVQLFHPITMFEISCRLIDSLVTNLISLFLKKFEVLFAVQYVFLLNRRSRMKFFTAHYQWQNILSSFEKSSCQNPAAMKPRQMIKLRYLYLKKTCFWKKIEEDFLKSFYKFTNIQWLLNRISNGNCPPFHFHISRLFLVQYKMTRCQKYYIFFHWFSNDLLRNIA